MLSYHIKKVKLRNLQSFVNSYLFINSEIIPISKNRVISYLNNPRANQDDYVLYVAIYNDKIIAFRTLLSDKIFYKSHEYKFAWFSGSWVHEKFRRKGISTALMNEAFKDWKERLLYSNYAPSSKLLYDKSGKFSLFIKKEGIRLYFKIKLTELLIPKFESLHHIKPLLSVIDYVLFIFSSPIRWLQRNYFIGYLKYVEITDRMTDAHYDFINVNNKSIFKRGKEEFEWIFNFPWISSILNESKPYPFSFYAKRFYYKVFTVIDNGNIMAFALIKVRDGRIDVPVYLSLRKKENVYLAKSILAYSYKIGTNILTCYTNDFIKVANEERFLALYRKTMQQRFYASKQILMMLDIDDKATFDVNDGDGDNIFT